MVVVISGARWRPASFEGADGSPEWQGGRRTRDQVAEGEA